MATSNYYAWPVTVLRLKCFFDSTCIRVYELGLSENRNLPNPPESRYSDDNSKTL